MTAIRKPLRGARGAKRLDLSSMRAALADSRQWTALGVVVAPEDGGAHWEVVGDHADVMVEVELQPDRVPVFCRLAAGMWLVPDVGDEVAVIIPSGELEFMPTITCLLGRSVPTVQGPQPQRIVIVRGEVLIHDGAGGAVSLALKSDVERIETAITGAVPVPGDGGVALQATIVAGLATSLHGTHGTDEWPTGTTVLKAK